MFQACHPFAFFDYFRVPYEVRPALAAQQHPGGPAWEHVVQPSGAGRSLRWVDAAAAPGARLGRYRLRDATFVAHVLGDEQPGPFGLQIGPVVDEAGQVRAAVRRDDNGSVRLPFDPGEVMLRFWSETYGRSGPSALVRGYYLVRPLLPRRVQLRLRQAYTRVQDRSSFPAWPLEDSLHLFYRWLFGVLGELAAEPVPFLDPWPDGRSWALVLTHDVETAEGCERIELLRGAERALDLRSSWNFVPLRYRVPDGLLDGLRAEGCEIGVHGLRHDGRDLGSARLLARRLPEIRSYADRWEATGFRSPGTQRQWDLMPRLGFGYDSSYPDTDPYEPQPGGCGSYLPFFNRDLVELPITLPQDHTLFSILQRPDARVWLDKARLLRERHGMVLSLTHPDYAADRRVAAGYRELLAAFAGDGTAWRALPREVAAWWRERAASVLVRGEDGWRVDGPAAARGRVALGTAGVAETGAR